jgi:predicted porin
MKRNLISLAVASLLSGAAFAQTNVTIYGTVDVGFSHRGDNIEKGVASQNAIDSSQSADSLIGFKGVEDLGNGLKALFVLEAGFKADTGNQNSGQLFDEQAFLGLTGGFGTAIAGRLVAPRHGFLASLDPFGAGTVGRYRNVFNDIPLADVDHVDNAVAYVSPSFGGFNVTAAYSTNAIGQEGQLAGLDFEWANGTTVSLSPGYIEDEGNAKVFTVLPRYTNGPLDVGVVYQQIKVKDAYASINGGGAAYTDLSPKVTQWTIGGSYDLNVAKLSAYYDQVRYNSDVIFAVAGVDESAKLKTWGIGASFPFGKHAVLVSYNQSKFSVDSESAKARQWAVGYTYSLSKRTNFYAAYSDIHNDDGRGADVADSVGNSQGEGYQNGLQLGLKHTF